MESDIGPISGEYDCQYKLVPGKLYAGADGLLFKGHIFFFEHIRLFRWKEVTEVKRVDIENIRVVDSKKEHHEFSSIHNLERVWATLYSLHKESLNDDREGRTSLLSPLRANLRRMASDPSQPPAVSPNNTEAAYVAAATLSTMDDMRTISARRVVSSSNNSNNNSNGTGTGKQQNNTAPQPLSPVHVGDITGDLEEAWEQLTEGGAQSYADFALKVSHTPRRGTVGVSCQSYNFLHQ